MSGFKSHLEASTGLALKLDDVLHQLTQSVQKSSIPMSLDSDLSLLRLTIYAQLLFETKVKILKIYLTRY